MNHSNTKSFCIDNAIKELLEYNPYPKQSLSKKNSLTIFENKVKNFRKYEKQTTHVGKESKRNRKRHNRQFRRQNKHFTKNLLYLPTNDLLLNNHHLVPPVDTKTSG